ncbi:MAG: monovalent cation/H(+) antiporter subunit G [Candidatus Omnitrophica bacterium]|nr:monovalent cation/H(+) antiporter subunit G [Candidatus Omnitrophota bacterium]
MNEIGHVLIITGLIFDFCAAISLVRMPDMYSRLQSAAKSVCLGTCCILFGVFFCSADVSTGFKTLLVISFLIITAPVSVHALMRGAYKNNISAHPNWICDQYGQDQDAAARKK